MAKVTIPAESYLLCDACGCRCNHVNRERSGIFRIVADAVDLAGKPVGNGSYGYDLCDRCLSEIEAVVETKLKEIKTSCPSLSPTSSTTP